MKKQRLSHNVYTLESDKPPEVENEENEGKEEKEANVEMLHHSAGTRICSRKEKYQVRVKIVEGRQLGGANINPVCKVTLHGISKQTRAVKSSTNPWWDEIFFFHLEFTVEQLYSEMLDIRVNNARAFRSNTLIGFFKLDLGIIYDQPDHAFINKWLLLGNPDDTVSRAMGYIKFSAVVLGPGDDCPNLTPPAHSEEEDVESNLLLSAGVQLKPASFIFDVYQAIELPQMDSSVAEGMRKIIQSEQSKDLVDPYLAVTFAGRNAQSATIHGNDHPEWNERIFLDFQFPSMCEKIKLTLTDWDRLTEDDVIATYFLPISHISAPGEYGYLPNFGPSWINFYGSVREYADLNNEGDEINKGRGEGCAYRGRVLLSLKTNLGSFAEVKSLPIEKNELLQVMPYCRRRKYRLHAAFIDASMVSVIDTPVEFEVSIGNFGNKFEDTLTPSPSSTQPTNAIYDGCNYYFLPWKEVKPCVIITSQWEDIAFRLETVNMFLKIIDNLKANIKNIQKAVQSGKSKPEVAVQFIQMMNMLLEDLDFQLPEPIPGQHIANELDNQLRQLRKEELKSMRKKAFLLRESATDIDEAMSEVEGYVKTLETLAIEPQNSIPDVVIWMLSGKKRVAYCRIPTYQILFSPDAERCGKYCGKLQSVLLKYPQKGGSGQMDANGTGGSKQSKNMWSSKYWRVPALLRIKLWFGLEVYDVFWSTSQTDAEMSVFAETYENQISVFGKWTTGGPTMTRPAWSDANGIIALPRENFVAPYGWRFDGEWFVSPEPSMMYEDEIVHQTYIEEIYENESRLPGGPWSPAPVPWTDFNGETVPPKDEIQVLPGWIWESNWEVDLNRAVDEDGWEYHIEGETSGYQPVEMTHHVVRRRRWVRRRSCLQGIPEISLEKDDDDNDDALSTVSTRSMAMSEEGWEYAPLFNMKFHAKERRMDLVRRRRWHRKLVAEDPSAPLVFNLAVTPKKTSIVRKMLGTESVAGDTKTVEDAKLAMLSCPRLFLIFKEAHKFQLRAYIYQARDLLAADRTGFSDPYVCVSIMNQSRKTAVIAQSLCPTFDQTLIFEEIVFYGDVETVLAEPPIIVIEVYDQDAFGEDEFMGRCIAIPAVHLNPGKSNPPRLEWYELYRETIPAGELLASYELFLTDVGELPYAPPKRGDIFIVPTGIRPVLQRTALEILCWGVRNMKTFEFTHISRPSVEFDCGGTIVESKFIKDAKVNPNFDDPLLYIEMLLPLEEMYMPPMHIKVRDHRQFGRKPIVGTHVIHSLHTFRTDPVYPTDNHTKTVEIDVEKPFDKKKSSLGLLEEVVIDIPEKKESKDKSDTESDGIDWWAKYYASIGEIRKSGKYLEKGYDLIEVYRTELERVDTFKGFTDFLNTFALKRGKTKDLEESDIVGEFKGTLRVYPLPPDPKAPHPLKIFQGLTQATVEEVTVRVYVIKAIDLAPMDPNGLADPYVVVKLGKKKQDNKGRYKPNTINPTFGEMFELAGTLPIDKDLTISIWDYDLASGDDLIGNTVIDLENRYVTKHRATCGLPKSYQTSGPNQWRDSKTPKDILVDMCQLNNMPPPVFEGEILYLADKKYSIKDFEKSEPINPNYGPVDQRLALHVLNLGFNLVPEHVETRSLYNPTTPELEQGKVEMWVDIFPKSMGKPGPTIDITPRSTTKFELRIVVWNTNDVLLTETNIMGDQMSDIYVKAWISGMDGIQKTDVHYRSMDGDGNFNWRFVFPFEYLVAENTIVIKKKEHFWSLDVTEHHLPPKVILQIWDNDTFSSDDFIGCLEIDLTAMPQPAKLASRCSLQQLGYEKKQTALDKLILKSQKTEVGYINLFEKKRIYGYWPFVAENDDKEKILAGKIEMEMEIVSEEEIEKKPAGFGRDEPNMNPVLEPPNRPATSFLWFTSPWKSFKHIIWKKYRLVIITTIIILFSVALVVLFIYSFPELLANKLLAL